MLLLGDFKNPVYLRSRDTAKGLLCYIFVVKKETEETPFVNIPLLFTTTTTTENLLLFLSKSRAYLNRVSLCSELSDIFVTFLYLMAKGCFRFHVFGYVQTCTFNGLVGRRMLFLIASFKEATILSVSGTIRVAYS